MTIRMNAAPVPDQDGEDFPAFRGWAGWGERVEPVAPDDDYPQPSFAPCEPTSYEREYPHRARPGAAGLPAGSRLCARLGLRAGPGLPA